MQGLGFFVPSIYLPTYTKALGFSSAVSALPIILINMAAVIGSISMGSIVDRTHHCHSHLHHRCYALRLLDLGLQHLSTAAAHILLHVWSLRGQLHQYLAWHPEDSANEYGSDGKLYGLLFLVNG